MVSGCEDEEKEKVEEVEDMGVSGIMHLSSRCQAIEMRVWIQSRVG